MEPTCILCGLEFDGESVAHAGGEAHACCAATGLTEPGAIADPATPSPARYRTPDEWADACDRAYEAPFPKPLTAEARRIVQQLIDRSCEAAWERRSGVRG